MRGEFRQVCTWHVCLHGLIGSRRRGQEAVGINPYPEAPSGKQTKHALIGSRKECWQARRCARRYLDKFLLLAVEVLVKDTVKILFETRGGGALSGDALQGHSTGAEAHGAYGRRARPRSRMHSARVLVAPLKVPSGR